MCGEVLEWVPRLAPDLYYAVPFRPLPQQPTHLVNRGGVWLCLTALKAHLGGSE